MVMKLHLVNFNKFLKSYTNILLNITKYLILAIFYHKGVFFNFLRSNAQHKFDMRNSSTHLSTHQESLSLCKCERLAIDNFARRFS